VFSETVDPNSEKGEIKIIFALKSWLFSMDTLNVEEIYCIVTLIL